MSKRVEKEIEKIYNAVFNRVLKRFSRRKLITASKKDIEKNILKVANSKFYEEFSKKFAKSLAKKGLAESRGVWRKYFEAARKSQKGVIYANYSSFQKAQMYKVVEHNFKMIRSIPAHILQVYQHQYIKKLKSQVMSGTSSRGSFEKTLREAGHKNSKLIARTETAKLQTSILENRSTDLGSPAYIWRSSNDQRTRESHRLMNSVVVFWRKNDDEKPNIDNMFGNAGEFPNCRCSPRPIFNSNDLTNSRYKVYNYKLKKVVVMTKAELSKVIDKGSL